MKAIVLTILIVCIVAAEAASSCVSGTCEGPVLARYTDSDCKNRDPANPYIQLLDNPGQGGQCSTESVSSFGFTFTSSRFTCGTRIIQKGYGPSGCSGKSSTLMSPTTGDCIKISSNRWGTYECAGASSLAISILVIVSAVIASMLL